MTTTETEASDLGDVHAVPAAGSTVVSSGAASGAGPRTSHVVLRHVQPKSVLKLSLVFYLCVCLVLLVAGVLLWIGASAAGVVGNVEHFFRSAGFDGFRFSPLVLLRAFAVGGVVLVVAGTIANLLLAMLFNVMSDVVGGVRLTLEEDVRGQR